MTAVAADISIEVETVLTVPWLRRVLAETLAEIGESDVHVGLMIVSEAESRQLNREYRGQDRATNVISFPMRNDRYEKEEELGDIVVCYSVAVAEMKVETGRPTLEKKEIMIKIAELVVHGVLHLCGIHHDTQEEETAMYEMMEQCLSRMDGQLI